MYAEIMSLNVRGVLLIIGAIFLTSYCEGICPRTNLSPNACVNECIPSLGCASSKTFCVCDGDCGYSCVKTDLDCGSPLPRRLANGNRTVSGTKFNDTATFRCDPGFKLSGSGVRQCRGQGTWDGLKPRCKIFCADPGVTKTTKRSKPTSINGFKAGAVLEYYCIPNHVLHGKSIITCKDDGWWSDPAPKCIAPQCPSPTLPHNSKVSFHTSDYKSGATNGTRLILGCEPGYFKVGIGVMRCNGSGIWEILKLHSCSPVNCGDPGILKNGNRQGLLFHFKSNVSFVCHKCYKLVGVPYRICNANQQWSDQQPTCQRSPPCEKLSNLPHGEVSFSSTACGAKAVYSCKKGYNLVGLRERSCDKSGHWTGTAPHCKIVSCGRPLTIGSVILLNNGTVYPSTVKFKCPPDYVMEGKDFTTCQENGSWSNKVPECLVVSCGRPLTIGSVILLNNGTVYPSTVKFKCPPDYVMEGKDFTTCQENGSWSNKVPECLAPCSVKIAKNLLPNKKVYSHGERAQFDCKHGFSLRGLIDYQNPQCINGTWSPQMNIHPYCEGKETGTKIVKKFWESIPIFAGK